MKLESLLQYLDGYLGIPDHPDYGTAFNGLQVTGRAEIERLAVAVDASEAAISAAVEGGADLMIVHHGLLWDGAQPITGRFYRKIKALMDADMGLFSCHLPLDGHAEVGNCAILAREIGLDVNGSFAPYKEREIGWWGVLPEPMTPSELASRVEDVLGSAIHLIEGGPDRVEKVGVVTGGGASFIPDAVSAGLDALVTGEGSHHSHFDAVELGINVVFGGHYATETFGVRALAAHLEERFDLAWDFIDQPTGL